MALKAVHVSDVPNLDQVPENSPLALCSTRFFKGVNYDGDDEVKFGYNLPKFMVIGHRGSGMNILQSCDPRMKSIQENSILSFNAASKFPIDFIEFDVQVTKDECPVIFHDNFILTEDEVGKNLFRKTKDGRIFEWRVQNDDPLCTLQEAFKKVEHSIGFNIELKFDDHMVYTEEEVTHVLQAIMKVVNEYANDRPIIFSSFQPDAAQLIRNLQNTYPVFFLTNGGSEIYMDTRRNSLEEAIRVCLTGSLQGIVSEVRAIIRNPGVVTRIKESKLCLITYGQLNNVPEVAWMQHLVGVEGVIVDLVKEITEAISDYIKPAKDYDEDSLFVEEAEKQVTTKPRFTQHELSLLLLKISPELIQS
ncbi:glycerophosphodiester phosphodiesterase GDPD1, chloroplastic-like isoform X2 [Quercus lobata]|uniref:glycerophosphodiester phosphodiesterase GDPD1, chloroplastic-like isoform X2 n=1 Tax=Quercus lobata TaxID=97700 RepID=UPI001244BD28|nr:glycerophosphodiester phosphodiesterase GDPD1, chloroplastic-like isoform X2 [Quercus lobata]